MLHPSVPSSGTRATGALAGVVMRSVDTMIEADVEVGPRPGLGQLSQRDFDRLAAFIQDYSGINPHSPSKSLISLS